MNILENIIRKALFERKQRLNEAIGDWQYDGTWSTRFASKVAGAAPKSLKGFTVISKGEKLPDELTDITVDVEKFLNFAVDVKPDIGIAPYNTGAYFIVLGRDSRVTRSEKRLGTEINDAINCLVFPIDNFKDILDNIYIQYVAINAWKYPAAKGTSFETPRMRTLDFDDITVDGFGKSPFVVIGDLEDLYSEYTQLLPIAREMKNTPQPNGDINRIEDINNAIESIETFLQEWPNWPVLSKILAPKAGAQPRVRVVGSGDPTVEASAEKWDATDSKQAAALAGQSDAEQAAQADADAIAAGNSIVDVQDQEYKTTDSPTGKIMFTGKWNLETQQPIDGVATDEAGNTWEGIWNENGQFFTGAGYRKLSNGDEWSGGIIKGFIKGSGEYKSPNFSFIGKVTHENGLVVPLNGNINQKWQSETVPSKFESFKGEIVNGKRYDGSWVRYVLESGKIVEYVYTGTLTSTADGEIPNNGSVTKDGKLFGTYNAGVFTETSKK